MASSRRRRSREKLRQQLARLADYYNLPIQSRKEKQLVIQTAYGDHNITARQAERLQLVT